ncbi:UPF0481 protein At3g47200 [Cryptomeria japonica]|uniref:UPF0481 protein At3g47200 n=1 Tax=Cryptomeria japonica TaxID=3369 RepID=UPI0027D9EA4A|nr:UPF0481 protein At3g47200 [Cryptomeria japonica]
MKKSSLLKPEKVMYSNRYKRFVDIGRIEVFNKKLLVEVLCFGLPRAKSMRLQIEEAEWLIQVKEEVLSCHAHNHTSPSILSVPKTLLNENEAAYIPEIVSIGPYHFGKPELTPMEKYKAQAVCRLSTRIQEKFPEKDFFCVVEKLKIMERQIRDCYDKEIECSGEVLCWIMARDASFLLEFFRNYITPFQPTDQIFCQNFHPVFRPENDNSTVLAIIKDVMKLENQIPLFVLEQVLSVEMNSMELARDKIDLVLKIVFANIYRPFDFYIFCRSSKRSHILEMYHFSCFGKDIVSETEKDLWNSWPKSSDIRFKLPSAVKLKKAGVKFRANAGGIEQIKFDKKTSVLSLPLIILNVESEVFIRNLVAFEMCSPNYKVKKLTQYAQFMSDLMHNKKGAVVMREMGMIVGNLRNSAQLASLFNLSNQSPSLSECSAVAETRKSIQEYYSKKWRIGYKILWNEFWKAYVSKPWYVIGGLGATVIFFLTAMQVICLFYTCTPQN